MDSNAISDDDGAFANFKDVDGEEEEEFEFGERPKFDAGVDANEEEDPKKFIEQLSGKLGQSLRDYTSTNGEPDPKLEKYAINSVISATNPDSMDEKDIKDIIKKLKKDDGMDGESDEEVEDEDETIELNESANRNVANYFLSLVDKSLIKTKKPMEVKEPVEEIKNEAPVKEPTTKPRVLPEISPVERPLRRSKPFNPKRLPSVSPTPKLDLNGGL